MRSSPKARALKYTSGSDGALLASLTADGLAEHLFDVANQLNRGAALLVDHDEKVRVAEIDLEAGRKAKASAAYASAREYFVAGMALLDEGDWSSDIRIDVQPVARTRGMRAFVRQLRQGRATDCGVVAARRIESRRGRSLLSEGPTPYHEIGTPGGRDHRAHCLRGFGIDMPAHPTEEQVQSEYAKL